VLLRVFIESSVDDFCQKNTITLTVLEVNKEDANRTYRRSMSLREKIGAVTSHMEENGLVV